MTSSFTHTALKSTKYSDAVRAQSLYNQIRSFEDSLIHQVLDSLPDGLLILTKQAKILGSNRYAEEICQAITPQPSSNILTIPKPIWDICSILIENQDCFPDKKIILEDEIQGSNGQTFRIRVQWMAPYSHNHLLVTVEDRQQSAKRRAQAEAKRYHLTKRETDVWRLYRRGYAYKDIAAELFIALNTVKKHMKSIHAKRQAG